jgi:hypothetical protein
MLHDLGECEVKHGVRVHVVNLYTDELGNPKAPAKFHDQAAEKSEPARSPCLRRWIIGIVLGALVVIGGLALLRREGGGGKPITAEDKTSSSGTTAAIPEKSIAVLPFENLSHDPENAYFADGIQEEILTRLAKIADLKVISRTSTARYKSACESARSRTATAGSSSSGGQCPARGGSGPCQCPVDQSSG